MENPKVEAAFEALVQEVETALQALNQEGAKAFQTGNYEVARVLMDKGPPLLEFQARVNELWQDWRELFHNTPQPVRETLDKPEVAAPDSAELYEDATPQEAPGANGGGLDPPDVRRPKVEAAAGRREAQSHTPEDRFVVPVLQALVSMGGAAPVESVLEQVAEIMKPRLNKFDLAPVESDPDKPRWQHSTEWACEAMIKEGLLDWDGNSGAWLVTETGKKWLAKQFEA